MQQASWDSGPTPTRSAASRPSGYSRKSRPSSREVRFHAIATARSPCRAKCRFAAEISGLRVGSRFSRKGGASDSSSPALRLTRKAVSATASASEGLAPIHAMRPRRCESPCRQAARAFGSHSQGSVSVRLLPRFMGGTLPRLWAFDRCSRADEADIPEEAAAEPHARISMVPRIGLSIPTRDLSNSTSKMHSSSTLLESAS